MSTSLRFFSTISWMQCSMFNVVQLSLLSPDARARECHGSTFKRHHSATFRRECQWRDNPEGCVAFRFVSNPAPNHLVSYIPLAFIIFALAIIPKMLLEYLLVEISAALVGQYFKGI